MAFLNQERKFTYITLDSTGSTQDEALRLYHLAGCGNFIITAQSQTRARGRNHSTWVAPRGNLNFTMFISSFLESIQTQYLPFILSLALHQVLEQYVQDGKLIIKWPNDLLIDNQKVAGILIETAIAASTRKAIYINIGIGVNILEAPQVAGRKLTALSSHAKDEINAEILAEPVKERILYWMGKANQLKWSDLKELWLSKAEALGCEMTTTYNQQKITGIFEDLGEKGELILRLNNGEKLAINSGVL